MRLAPLSSLLHNWKEVSALKSRKFLGSFLLLAIAVMSGAISHRNQTLAADYSCKSSSCPNSSQCTGDRWSKTGSCSITCYKEAGAPGEIIYSGSANCGTSPDSGVGGSGGGSMEGGGCSTDWDCFAGESCNQSTGSCEAYGGGIGGLLGE